MKQNLLKTMLVSTALVAGTMGVWADDFVTYYSQDYEGKDAPVDWTTSAVTRYTPILQTDDDNTFLTVNQSERYNNGCTLTNSSVNIGAGTDFTIIFDLKLGSHTDARKGSAVFTIKDAENSSAIFSLSDAGASSTKWIVNGDNDLQLDLPGTGKVANVWYTFKVTRNGNITYLTVTNTKTGDVVLERTVIKTLSEKGGVGKMTFETSRYWANLAIDNVLARSLTGDDVPATPVFTVVTKYQLEDGTVIAEDRTDAIESGSKFTPTYDESFDDENYRYTYKSGANEIASVGADATVTVVYTREELANWAITVKAGGELNESLAEFTVKDAKNATYTYPRYINKDSNLYQIKKGRYDQGYVRTINSVKGNEEVTEEYLLNSKNVAFFAEAEEISSLTSVESGKVPDRCSSGKAAYAASDAVIAHLSAGSYIIKAAVFGNKGLTFNFKVGDKTVYSPDTKGYFFESESEVFTLDADADVVLAAGGNAGGSPKVVDYIAIMKTAEPVIVSDVKFATYVPTCNVVVPSEAKVYTAKVNEAKSAVVLTEVPANSVIAKGTPVLVGAEPGSYNFTASTEEAATIENNDLKAATADTKGDGATIYALVEQDGKAVFAPLKEGVVVSLGHAYLELPAASAARFYSIQFGGETTGINEVNAAAKADGAYYTLQGVKTSKAAKGIYIHNGKKVVIK